MTGTHKNRIIDQIRLLLLFTAVLAAFYGGGTESIAASVLTVNETLSASAQNINIAGISGQKLVYTDFGGSDRYTVLPSLAGDVEIRDNQAGKVYLPVGLDFSSARFMSNGVQFTINGYTLTLLGRPDLFTFVFATTPLKPGLGVSRTFSETAQAFGATIPASGSSDATITGTIQTDGSIKAAIRYQDNGNGCVTDLKTGLVWKKASEPGYFTWHQAITMQGLPSKDQLLSLVPDSEEERQEMYATFTGDYGTWSSTPYGEVDAWLVNIGYGNGSWSYKYNGSTVRLLCSGH